jgi:hypothetical protein
MQRRMGVSGLDGPTLKQRLHDLGLKGAEAAKLIGVTHRCLTRYLNGHRSIPISVANAVDREIMLQQLWQMVHAVPSDQHVSRVALTTILLAHGPRHLKRGVVERRGRPPPTTDDGSAVQIGIRSVGHVRCDGLRNGRIDGPPVCDRPQALRLRRPASRLRGLTSFTRREPSIDALDGRSRSSAASEVWTWWTLSG